MAKSIWAVLVVILGSAMLLPALNSGTPAVANRTAATNVSVAVGEPLANSILGLLAIVAAALFMAALVGGGEF